MSSKKKAAELIPKIIHAVDRDNAILVLKDVLDSLHLTNDYTELVSIKSNLENYEQQFRVISDEYRALESPKHFNQVHKIRTDLNFLYRDISDEMSFDINKLKVYYEEGKTSVRADSMMALKVNEEFQKKIKASSASALRDIVGADDGYKEYVSLASVAYGLYINLRNLLDSIRMMTDSMASESKQLYTIEQKDVK